MKSNEIEIVVVEDEADILELLEYQLQKAGYAVTGFLSTQNVEKFLEQESVSLMIIDRNLPDIEGSEFVRHLREMGFDVPVIFLSAKDAPSDIIDGFKRGGDDYMTKPFNTNELLVRVEAILKRSGVKVLDKIRYRDMILDIKNRLLKIDDKVLELTNMEYHILYLFLKNPNKVIHRDVLRDEIWGDCGDDFQEKTINVAINRLKKKIDPNSEKDYLISIWGVGYKLV
ncbi:MAG: response regulator transcription factor [Sulfurovum sp.]|nr:MAG: response regulator transcription factor [Sulfurovum sp.]